MFKIAKNLVKTFEQTLSLSDQDRLDGFFQSIPPNLLESQIHSNTDMSTLSDVLSGLRVVYVDELQLQLESYFDFIVGISYYIINRGKYYFKVYHRPYQTAFGTGKKTCGR